jgi:hypothetical protein
MTFPLCSEGYLVNTIPHPGEQVPRRTLAVRNIADIDAGGRVGPNHYALRICIDVLKQFPNSDRIRIRQADPVLPMTYGSDHMILLAH